MAAALDEAEGHHAVEGSAQVGPKVSPQTHNTAMSSDHTTHMASNSEVLRVPTQSGARLMCCGSVQILSSRLKCPCLLLPPCAGDAAPGGGAGGPRHHGPHRPCQVPPSASISAWHRLSCASCMAAPRPLHCLHFTCSRLCTMIGSLKLWLGSFLRCVAPPYVATFGGFILPTERRCWRRWARCRTSASPGASWMPTPPRCRTRCQPLRPWHIFLGTIWSPPVQRASLRRIRIRSLSVLVVSPLQERSAVSPALKLRCVFLKLRSGLELPLLRVAQAGDPAAATLQRYYSSALLAYVRKVLEVRELFRKLCQILLHFQCKKGSPVNIGLAALGWLNMSCSATTPPRCWPMCARSWRYGGYRQTLTIHNTHDQKSA